MADMDRLNICSSCLYGILSETAAAAAAWATKEKSIKKEKKVKT